MTTRATQLTVGLPRRGAISGVIASLGDLIRRRRLTWYLVVASVRRQGADTLLGNLWWFFDPALQLAIYYLLVAVIFQRAQPAYILFLAAAILPWKWFTAALAGATNSIRVREPVLRQIAFPTIVLPVSEVLAETASFAFSIVPLAALYLIYPERLTPWVLTVPLIAVIQLLWTIPLAMLLAAANVFLRDIGLFVSHALRLWFYLSPALFSVETLRQFGDRHPPVNVLISLNPFTWLFGAYRDAIYEGRAPDWLSLLALAAASLPVIFVATYLFRRAAPSFVKVL
jgi:ABC-type polysaccharide/polyol phosphate export permease